MDDKQFPNEQTTPDTNNETVSTEQSVVESQNQTVSQPEARKAQNGKKLLYAVLAAVAGLLLILIVLLAMLLAKKDEDPTVSTNTEISSESNSEKATSKKEKKDILFVAPSTNEKLEYVIYKPKQNASNTTISFGVRSACEGCEDAQNVFDATNQFDSRTNSYLLDENLGKKYSPIKDEDGKVLASPSCYGSVKKGETFDCFVAFTKVPSGSTVSWIFGKNRIDNIKVE